MDLSGVYMFHQVLHRPVTERPHQHFFSASLLDDFISYTKNNYKFVEPSSAINQLKREGSLEPGEILLTFDDGLACHAQVVWPLLKKHGVKGLFFIPTVPLISDELLPIHLSHCVSGAIGNERYLEFFEKALKVKNCEAVDVDTSTAKRAYPFDNERIAKFKYFKNFILDADLSKKIDADLAEMLNLNLQNYYMCQQDISTMCEDGHFFGLHGHTHRAFSALNEVQFDFEINTSVRLLSKVTKRSPVAISYPFGDLTSVTKPQMETLAQKGIVVGFFAEDMVSGDNMAIGRVDCAYLMQRFNQRNEAW